LPSRAQHPLKVFRDRDWTSARLPTVAIIYISGNTGNPKGLMHSHLGVIRAGGRGGDDHDHVTRNGNGAV
jgi:long-subunit acyl-CoA synthetase (AMP-forming)